MSDSLKVIYTDGGCHNEAGDKKGVGSSAWLEPTDLSNSFVYVYGKYFMDTTNNRTEMLAILNGINFIDDITTDIHPNIMVITDSGYVVKGYTNPAYLDRWISNGWKTSTRKPVQNRDLWEKFIEIPWQVKFNLELIKGHKKDRNHIHSFWNDICDVACTHIMEHATEIDTTYRLKYDFKSKKIVEMEVI